MKYYIFLLFCIVNYTYACEKSLLVYCNNCNDLIVKQQLNNFVNVLDICWDENIDFTHSEYGLILKLQNDYDILLSFNTLSSIIWNEETGDIVKSYINNGLNMIVYDRKADSSTIPDLNNYVVHGIEHPDILSPVHQYNLPNTGKYGQVGQLGPDARTNYGYILESFYDIHPETKEYFIRDGSGNKVMVEYMINKGRIIYSTIPAQWFLTHSSGISIRIKILVANTIEMMMYDNPYCVLWYTHLFVHNVNLYKSFRFTHRCININSEFGIDIPVLPRISDKVIVYTNNDCNGHQLVLNTCAWNDYNILENFPERFGVCSDYGNNVVKISDLPDIVTHIQCDSDWKIIEVVDREAFVLKPLNECIACNGYLCDWKEYIYPITCQ